MVADERNAGTICAVHVYQPETNMKSPVFSRKSLGAVLILVLLSFCGCNQSPEAKSAKFLSRGKQLLEKKDPARAILEFQNALKATPKNAEVYFQLARAYLANS